MNLENRVARLEKGVQIDVPSGAKLYDGDGIQVDAIITRVPGKSYGEAQMADGTIRPIAPTPTWTLEDVIRRARNREKKEETGESHAREELPADILFLRVDGREGFCEIMDKAQKRRKSQEGHNERGKANDV